MTSKISETTDRIPMRSDQMNEHSALASSAIRMRRLRKRRKNGWTRVVPVELGAMDAVALRAAGFLRPGESAVDGLPDALRRLVASIR